MKIEKEIYVILDNVRSVHNVGSIFRTADAAGVSKIILCGYTPTPIDRFGRARKDFAKTALGAEKSVPWESEKDTYTAINKIKQLGFSVIGVEQAPDSIDYRKLKPTAKTAFVFGNETDGLSAEILKSCDLIAEIPMQGRKESLNVSVAAGIVLFQNIFQSQS